MIEHIGLVTMILSGIGMLWARYSHEVPMGWFLMFCAAFVMGLTMLVAG